MTWELSESDKALAAKMDARDRAEKQSVLEELIPAMAFTTDASGWVIDAYEGGYFGYEGDEDECSYPGWRVSHGGSEMQMVWGQLEFKCETHTKRGGGYDYERTARALMRAADAWGERT